VVEPGVARHAGHEEDQVGGKLAALGDHLVGLEALQLVAQVGAMPRRAISASRWRTALAAQAVAGLGGD
jgi:hypothetical protein